MSTSLLIVIHTNFLIDAITGRKAVAMAYANYDLDIQHRYQIELIGWPSHITFQSPSKITTSAALRAVRDALKSGLCRWAPLSHESREELAKRVDSGQVAKKHRAPRADKGSKRGPRSGIGKESIPPKQPRRTTRPNSSLSAEFVEESD